jgi:hypothetical protein
MELTQFGYVILPLCALLCVSPQFLLQTVFLASVFGAAAALIIGSLGLPPAIPPAVVFMLFVTLQYALGARFPGEREAWKLLEPLAVTVAYALASSLIVPRALRGLFDVWPQKVGPSDAFAIPLGPSASNATQDMYLISNVVFLVMAVAYLTRSKVDFTRLVNAYYASGFVAVGISLWQLANRVAGIPFPDDFFYSNPGWTIFPAQVLNGVPRINGPFSEPAALAFYLTGIVFSTCWTLVRGHRSRLATYLLPCALVALMLSTSTTGYVAMLLGGAVLLLYALFGSVPAVRMRILTFGVPLLAIGLIAMAAATVLDPQLGRSVAMVTQETLNKDQGSSFQDRTTLDYDSMALLLPSYGFGAGWGSERASSLIPGLLANLGIYGIVPLIWFVWRLTGSVRRLRDVPISPGRRLTIDAMSGSLVGTLTAAALSAPAITNLDFYLCLAVLMACVARIDFERVNGLADGGVA